ncbi:hypothetical protein [Campylobacter hyointestinalis]|uniref:hypothetical protein n=1 Tax=Campylobacter hyointestinalis TaxID=198 RepID=UPI000CE45251|nr:hypothetical protein [Campylobacter hyointestinalis]PPB54632.1 hypothetical protein CDQ67_07530 [Campylobacter hyointestinalis subsp. hyointestinalis]
MDYICLTDIFPMKDDKWNITKEYKCLSRIMHHIRKNTGKVFIDYISYTERNKNYIDESVVKLCIDYCNKIIEYKTNERCFYGKVLYQEDFIRVRDKLQDTLKRMRNELL